MSGPKRLGVLCFVLAATFCPREGTAQVSAANSDVPACINLSLGTPFANNPIGNYKVTVRDVGGSVVPGATVGVNFLGADTLIAWCDGQPHPIIPTALTGVDGSVTFTIQGGGCVTDQACAQPAALVHVTGPAGVEGHFAVDIFCVNSPDAVNQNGQGSSCLPRTTCNPQFNNTAVGLTDAVYHTFGIKVGGINLCSNFTPPFDDPLGVLDAVFLTPYIKASRFCNCD